MNKSGKVQRSTKIERQASMEVLKGLWKRAYTDGAWQVSYEEQGGIDGEMKAKTLHEALASYRKQIRKHQTKNFEIFVMITACSLFKVNKYTVKLERKPQRFSNRANVILELAGEVPELNLIESNNPMDNITNDFK